MGRRADLRAEDLEQIEALAERAGQLIGRRRFAVTSTAAIAFAVPALVTTIVPRDALAQPWGSKGHMGHMHF